MGLVDGDFIYTFIDFYDLINKSLAFILTATFF